MKAVQRPPGVSAFASVNAIAAVLTLLFWGLVYVRLFAGGPIADPVLRASSAATLGFLVGDLVWAVPLLALSVVGLWQMRDWGWLAAQAVNTMWLYSMTVIWVRDVFAGSVSPGAILFTPFAVLAAWCAVYLWRQRDLFRARAAAGSEDRA